MSWELRITKEQFLELYGDKIDIGVFEQEPKDEAELVTRYMTCKLWRLNNLYTIVDKDGVRCLFVMNYAQHRVYAASLKHSRLIILKSRQQGISTFWLISYLDDALMLPDMNVGLMAQGKSEASTLLKRVKLAWQCFPSEVRDFLGITLVRDNTEELFFSTGATLFIRTSFRSATLQRLHISEFGKIANKYPDRAMETKTGTLQAIRPGNTCVIESTAEGDNEFKTMWDNAVEAVARKKLNSRKKLGGKDFMPVFLSWVDDPDCWAEGDEEASSTQEEYFSELEGLLGCKLSKGQRTFWIQQYRELGDAIYQEYPATPQEAFTKVNNGSYYGVAYHGLVVGQKRVVNQLYDPNLEVYVAMDLGVNDMFVMVYFQRWRAEWRIVNEYSNCGEGLEFYVKQMRSMPYKIKQVICPHDIKVTELSTGKSRLARLRELGVTNVKVLARNPIEDGIERMRSILPNLWVDPKCDYLIGCLKNYSKEWDDKHGVWKAKPLHDKWSHGADALRVMAMSGARHTSPRQANRERFEASSVINGLAI